MLPDGDSPTEPLVGPPTRGVQAVADNVDRQSLRTARLVFHDGKSRKVGRACLISLFIVFGALLCLSITSAALLGDGPDSGSRLGLAIAAAALTAVLQLVIAVGDSFARSAIAGAQQLVTTLAAVIVGVLIGSAQASVDGSATPVVMAAAMAGVVCVANLILGYVMTLNSATREQPLFAWA